MSVLNKKQLTQRMSGLNKFNYINNNNIELNNLLITLEQILSTYWNTYITFIVEGKITDARSLFFYNIFIQFVFS